MRPFVFLCIAALLVPFIPGLGGTVTVVDQAGREVTVHLPVKRVVSLYGVATMYLYALGVHDRLVLGTYVALRPGTPSWEALAAVDPDLEGKYTRTKASLEEVLAREPDLVLASSRDLEMAQGLAAFGVLAVVLHAEDVAGIEGATALLGRIFGVEARADRLLGYFRANVERISGLIAEKGLVAPRVLFVGTRPLRVASGEMYQTQLIELAGGIPVAKELRGYWQDVDIEQVLLWDPEVVFIAPYGKVTPADLAGDPAWHGVTAVRAGRVYKMPRVFSPWDIPTPESFLGLLWMAAKMHPDLGIEVVPEAEAFYREFYGYELPRDLAAVIGG
ncbi:ABC transporter substrate-binding protein [Candidatus Bipolaricaulota sp. J31]